MKHRGSEARGTTSVCRLYDVTSASPALEPLPVVPAIDEMNNCPLAMTQRGSWNQHQPPLLLKVVGVPLNWPRAVPASSNITNPGTATAARIDSLRASDFTWHVADGSIATKTIAKVKFGRNKGSMSSKNGFWHVDCLPSPSGRGAGGEGLLVHNAVGFNCLYPVGTDLQYTEA
jgi:hypothetical protein